MNILENKKAHLSYEILDTITAGIVLSGSEVKSLRQNHGSINDAFVVIDDGAVMLAKAFIPPYQLKNTSPSYDPYQKRKLLLNKSEIRNWMQKKSESGLTLIPLKMYNENRKIKVLLGLAKGKKKHDKREDLKKRDAQREISRLMKH
jgi:SsrA-binding protein